jgi:hypothetical protein
MVISNLNGGADNGGTGVLRTLSISFRRVGFGSSGTGGKCIADGMQSLRWSRGWDLPSTLTLESRARFMRSLLRDNARFEADTDSDA